MSQENKKQNRDIQTRHSRLDRESMDKTFSLQFIHICFYLLFFVTPLLLWPFTSEVFEFNKMLFVYLMTIIIGAAWLVRSFTQKKFEVARTPLDIPILLFLVSQIISTFVSIDIHTSIWGYYSRFHGGLASTVCYILLFYALVTHFAGQSKAIKNLIYAILSTAAITSLYALMEKMGIDKHIWIQDVQNRVFSTLGQPNWLSAYLIAILPLSLYKAVNNQDTNAKISYSILSIIFFLAILFTKSQSGIGATVVVLIAFTIITAFQHKKSKLLLLGIPFILLLIFFKGNSIKNTLHSLNKTNPFYSNTITIINEDNKTRGGGTDSMAIRRIVWQGAVELGRRYPLFGTGVETFGYTYYWVRPAIHNLTSESDFLYNKAHNEYLNFLANTGFFGLFSYLFLIFSIIKLMLKKDKRDTDSLDLSTPFLLGFIGILITNYFGFSVVNIALFFFLFPAILIAENKEVKKLTLIHDFNSIIATTIVVCLALWMCLEVKNMWLADINYTIGKSSLDENLTATKLNPDEPNYYSQLGSIQSLVAVQYIAPQIQKMDASAPAELKQKAKDYIDQYINSSIANVNKAIEMNPYSLNLLKTKARTEITLSALNPTFTFEALKTLLKVTELSPNEASGYFNIGILYLNLAEASRATNTPESNANAKSYLDSAKTAIQKSLELKPDYLPALEKISQFK